MDSPSEPAAPTPVTISRRRRWLFRAVCAALPVVALVAAEGLCRWAGYGGYPPAILRVGSDGTRTWYTTHRPGVDTYFHQRLSLTGGVRAFTFRTPKPPQTFRVFMFGGSAMQGYPQPLNLTNGAFLEAMLSDAWSGERRAEVLNFGATAMASFPAACFLDETIDLQPDLVIVMSGNNEFYGAFGVASLHRFGTTPWGMRLTRWMRQWGLAQWLDTLLVTPPADERVRRQTLMERVVAVGQIAADDPLRAAADRALEANLRQMARRCRARGVPLILCTLPTNERGMAPIGADVEPKLPAAQRAEFDALRARAEQEVRDGVAGAADTLRRALAIDSGSAGLHFLLAQALRAAGDPDGARRCFIEARDRDTMPWRASSRINDVVRRVAADESAIFCDMEAAFRAASPDGTIGWELMDDHVHMSLRGQALFAQVIARTIADRTDAPTSADARRSEGGPPAAPHSILPRLSHEALHKLPAWDEYARRLGRNEFDAYCAASRMRTLFDIPFMARANPEAQARAAQRCDELLAAMSEADRAAVRQWKDDPALHVSNHRPITMVVAYQRMLAGDVGGAAELFAIARRSVTNVSLWRLQLDWCWLHCRQRLAAPQAEEDRAVLADAIEVGELLRRFGGFHDALGPSYLGMVYNMAGDHAAAIQLLDDAVRYARGVEGWPVVVALADSLVRTGQAGRARLLLELAQRDPAMRAGAAQLLSRLNSAAASQPAP
ncbi:MAG: hypothetical protein CHACPFDD_00134 [Phycisphaerae bacterium]|nr:hypothetical protein [Phycisphaerae bacterium]